MFNKDKGLSGRSAQANILVEPMYIGVNSGPVVDFMMPTVTTTGPSSPTCAVMFMASCAGELTFSHGALVYLSFAYIQFLLTGVVNQVTLSVY